uniref:inactive leucine-rich repeat receptor-like protein kinase CORYNE n=1 Tax=Erigeron canadensis TaxID=72917 RepID=UPI001CB9D1DA|nr:inactive leucine-rich repeat receptor-like protein kinase CORYNE [Erigeron canadensis]
MWVRGYFKCVVWWWWLCCMECQAAAGVNSTSREKRGVLLKSILLGSTSGLGCALVCALLIRCIFIYIINRVPILRGPVVFSPSISPKSLQAALVSNQLVHLGGGPSSLNNNNAQEGGGGKYYKATLLDNGFTVAVKKLPPFDVNHNKTRRRMQRDLEILAGLRHRHLLTLRAYLYDEDTGSGSGSGRFCLVYDYVPSGSLEDAMKPRTDNGLLMLQMGWDARLRIAVGIIKALHFLHFTHSLCHFNLKPSNVLLDPDFEPRLTDSGFPPCASHHYYYYYAPECFPNFSMYTEKSDIFSFGVILGILLTGRDPSDPLFGQATSGSRGDMGMWFRQLVETGDAREALDKSLLGQEMEEDEMLMAVRIAAVCLSDMPADRPSSDELVPMLTQLHSF